MGALHLNRKKILIVFPIGSFASITLRIHLQTENTLARGSQQKNIFYMLCICKYLIQEFLAHGVYTKAGKK